MSWQAERRDVCVSFMDAALGIYNTYSLQSEQ